MCKATLITNIIFYLYTFIWIGVPILYLIMFRLYKSNRKSYLNALKYALIMFIVLFIPKLFGYIFYDSCYNCTINHICEKETKDKDNESEFVISEEKNEPTTKKTENISSTTTTTISTTTKKSDNVVYNGVSSKGYKIETINGVTYVDGMIIVNKTYPVPQDYVPTNTYKTPTSATKVCNDCINLEAYNAWQEMKADAQAVGLNLWIQSGYRPYKLQESLYNGYVKRDGKEAADKYSARAGYSEHQTALCFDINNPSKSFNGTVEAKWINDNAYKYGFIIRYPQGKEDETGYMYESWHVRYVGKELALTLYNDGDWITLESYLGITSKYAN
ncbi:MAG: M15 family metallopeptidase [Erysipelotrichales bacterium]|nr:M15 family metallopeptidase [Erysipelotrichales bacterium]